MHMIPIDLVQHIILCINASAGSSSLDTPFTTWTIMMVICIIFVIAVVATL